MMKKKIFTIITYLLIFFNSNLFSNENNNVLKIGLLAPLAGEYEELGKSLLYSLQLALEEIDDKNVLIIPRDSGFNDTKKLNNAIKEIKSQGANVIIGPINYDDFNEVKKFTDIVFISPSNINPEFQNNVISIGVSLESQMIALKKFIKKQNKKKPVILIPKNQYTDMIERKLKDMNFKYFTMMKNFNYLFTPDAFNGSGKDIILRYENEKVRVFELK